MKNSLAFRLQIHPLIIFWLGLLTGALIVGFIFFYKIVEPGEYESAILRRNKSYSVPQSVPQSLSTQSLPNPVGNYQALPNPVGNYQALPNPVGN